MNSREALIAAAIYFLLTCCAQETSIPPLKSEPHHHLLLHNAYVNVYSVEVQPHDSVQLHRHEVDGIGIMLSKSEITVRVPGKPDSHQNVTNGQLRLQSAGYVHSTSIDGDTPYRNVTVELLATQRSPQNLCATLIATQPTHCPAPRTKPNLDGRTEQPQFQTDQTEITLIRISPGQSATLDAPTFPQLLVILDKVECGTENGSGKSLRAGDFLWREANSVAQIFKDASPSEVRVVAFAFKNEKSAK
jgi:hypothetical protein